jgi:hypothetical protein
MCGFDFGFSMELMDMCVKEAQRAAERRSLARSAATESQEWGASLACRFLGQLGRQLVAWGQRLERYSLTQPSL